MVTPEPVIGPRPSWHRGKGSPPGGRVHLSCRPASAGPGEPAELRARGGPSAVGRQGSWAHVHVESRVEQEQGDQAGHLGSVVLPQLLDLTCVKM